MQKSIFGNAGDPYLPENDAAFDIAHWTGHTGCVILAPHLVGLTKRALGLPHIDDATVRERRDGMCWQDPAELYNGGEAFKVTSRDHRGVMVTVIADNYYGYCKKEVKTQISYAANLFGLAEEEHAGGALAFPAYVLGQEFYAGRTLYKTVTYPGEPEYIWVVVEKGKSSPHSRLPQSTSWVTPRSWCCAREPRVCRCRCGSARASGAQSRMPSGKASRSRQPAPVTCC